MKGSLSSQGLISDWNFRTDLPLPTNTVGYRTPTGSVGLLLAVRQLVDMEAAQTEEWVEAE
jgi:hypothetical protein